MKIIHVTPYYPPHLGGMENTVRELAERTAEMGHEVSVYTSNKTESKEKLKSTKNLTIKYLKSFELPHTPIIPALPFELLKEANKDTVVHIHFALAYTTEVANLFSRLRKAKIVTHIHTDPKPSSKMGFMLKFFKNIWRLVLPFSDVIICPTEDYVNLIPQIYGIPKERCRVIPSGIDLNKFLKINNSQKEKVKDILFVGRLSKEKNIPTLLQAFKLTQDKHNLTLHIVGEGGERLIIEEIIRKENIRNVILHGKMYNEELLNLYSTSDIFILPSHYESFGIVNLEAMASGLPIVASDIPGARNLLGSCGILVKPTAKNFADAIVRLIGDKNLREELIRRGKVKVRDYDWNKIVKEVVEIYEKI